MFIMCAKMKTIFCMSVFLLVASANVFGDDALVTIPNGQIKGRILQTPNNTTFYAYNGIPYATPPLGKLRFQAPQPAQKWDGVLEATQDSNECYQLTSDSAAENEDCLYINVYTPVLSTSQEKLPVMVFIYGGGFRAGGSGFKGVGPDYLIEQGIVVVTFNYRLGPFGFLSTGDTIVPGNAGLKDQNLALKWTNQNVEYFGGDSRKITIFGQSAGAASVGLQIISKQSAGLFRGAIAESGAALNTWALKTNPKSYVISLANIVSGTSKGEDSETLLEYLQSVDAKLIDTASTKLGLPLPVLEVDHEDAFMTKPMYELLDSGDFNQVPLIMGINSEEELSKAKDLDSLKTIAANFDKNVAGLVPGNLNLNTSVDKTALGEQIKSLYVGSSSFESNLGAAVRFYSDNVFTRAIIKHAELQSKYTDVYFYQFSYDGIMGNVDISIEGAEHVAHGEETKYILVQRSKVYDNSKLENFPDADVLTHKRMVELWSNFAKYLNPTPEKSDLLQNIVWPKVTPENYQYLDVDTDLKVKTDPKGTAYIGWKKIFDTYGVRPFATY